MGIYRQGKTEVWENDTTSIAKMFIFSVNVNILRTVIIAFTLTDLIEILLLNYKSYIIMVGNLVK